jgi:hypothetical protein
MKRVFRPKQGGEIFNRSLTKDPGELEAKIQKYRAVMCVAENQRGIALARSQERLGDLLYELGTLTNEYVHFRESQQAYCAALSALLICEVDSLTV